MADLWGRLQDALCDDEFRAQYEEAEAEQRAMVPYEPAALDIEEPVRVAHQHRPRRRKWPVPGPYDGPGVDPIPPTPFVMDEAAGAWVREHVLRGYLPGATEGYWRACSCQYGICGACARGRCDQCLTPRLAGREPGPETHITDRRGMVAYGVGSAVWLKHTTCRYVCPCRCPCRCPKVAPTAPVAPAPAPRPEQLDLLALLEVA